FFGQNVSVLEIVVRQLRSGRFTVVQEVNSSDPGGQGDHVEPGAPGKRADRASPQTWAVGQRRGQGGRVRGRTGSGPAGAARGRGDGGDCAAAAVRAPPALLAAGRPPGECAPA